MVSVPAPSRTATLLLCHGGGFCKEIWTPIISRLQESPLMKKAAPKIVSFDFQYHGSNCDVSEAATLRLENPKAPRVHHPAMYWAQWSKEEVQRRVQELRAAEAGQAKAPLIGIGHSMGASALLATEAANPGTFDGLILFEPMVNTEEYGTGDASVNFLVNITLKRTASWETFEEAEKEILAMRNFAKWHPESLQYYINGAVVKSSPENDAAGKFVLSCHPHIEASLYSHGALRLSDDELARVKCPTTFNYGEKSVMFFPQFKQRLVDKYPHVYRMAPAVPDTTHMLVMEDPDTVSSRILDTLSELPSFRPDSHL